MISTNALSQTSQPSPTVDLSCLSRPQKETIEACFEENKECHTSLKAEEDSQGSSDWGFFLGSVALGLVAGFAAGMAVHK
jgi:hypothetical protein